MSLFPQRLERISGELTSRGPVKVPHGANADYVVDHLGREWVRKKEIETGFNGLLAEAFGALFALNLQPPVPESAIQMSGHDRAWLERSHDRFSLSGTSQELLMK